MAQGEPEPGTGFPPGIDAAMSSVTPEEPEAERFVRQQGRMFGSAQ
jgi:hypothetical protein